MTEETAPDFTEDGRLLFAGPCEFIFGAAKPGDLPTLGPPEIAFAGRSNVGKSSLLNALTNRKTLARVSNTPGAHAATELLRARRRYARTGATAPRRHARLRLRCGRSDQGRRMVVADPRLFARARAARARLRADRRAARRQGKAWTRRCSASSTAAPCPIRSF